MSQGPQTLFVVFHRPGPAWKPGLPFMQQDGVRAHVAHFRQWHANGQLLIGGPFLDEAQGGMMVTAPGVSRETVDAFAAADPAVASGLLTFEVRPWMVGMATVALPQRPA